jgi:hypothetical protein
MDKIKYIIFETESYDEDQKKLLFEIIKEYSKFFNLEQIELFECDEFWVSVFKKIFKVD